MQIRYASNAIVVYRVYITVMSHITYSTNIMCYTSRLRSHVAHLTKPTNVHTLATRYIYIQ